MTLLTIRLPCARASAAALACLFGVRAASGQQAFVPPAGEGNVTISYQNLFARGHYDLNGDRMPGESGQDVTQGHAIVMEAEFALTNRLAFNLSLPYIGSTYEGELPHRVMGVGPPQEWDDGDFHSTFQDFRFAVRYNIVRRPFAVTPFTEVVIPSHAYPSLAHAAVGKDLHAYVVGGAVGGFFDAFLPRLFFHTVVSHAWVEEILDIRPNRSRVENELGYFFTPRLSLRFLQSYQVTHQGIDLKSFTPMTDGVIHDHSEIPFTAEYRRVHDRLQRSNYLTLGGGVGFAVNDTMDVFADVAQLVWGENVHPLRGITIGVNAHFRTRRPTP